MFLEAIIDWFSSCIVNVGLKSTDRDRIREYKLVLDVIFIMLQLKEIIERRIHDER